MPLRLPPVLAELAAGEDALQTDWGPVPQQPQLGDVSRKRCQRLDRIGTRMTQVLQRLWVTLKILL